jgi:lysophospholipase L1-like esterase
MFLPAALVALSLAAAPEQPKPFEFKDGDRVVWIGNTLVEREQRYGYWETALLAANAGKKITVRNLGWSGDTVHAEARGRFDFANPDACFKQLVNLALELKPTVIFVSYGTNESFEGSQGLPKFEKGLEKLLDALKPANARVVLFSPTPFEKSASLPNPEERNRQLAAYGDVIRATAEKRNVGFIDLFGRVMALNKANQNSSYWPLLTDNGMHFDKQGYEITAPLLVTTGITDPAYPRAVSLLAVNNSQSERLRQAVVAKNELFFHRWRPQNETYLFGFRKHEQGRNAKEVAEFDPLVAKAEDEIDRLRKADDTTLSGDTPPVVPGTPTLACPAPCVWPYATPPTRRWHLLPWRRYPHR